MIYDMIINKGNYEGLPKLKKALDYLFTLTLDNMPEEKLQLDGERLFVVPQHVTTAAPENCVVEAHRKYIDIHFVLSGYEMISTAPLSTMEESTSYDADADVAYYTGKLTGACVLNSGCFMVCFPEDVHQPGGMLDKPAALTKVVVKIRV